MPARKRKSTREHDVTGRYLAGDFDEDHADKSQRFSNRNKNAQQDKMEKTTAMRAANTAAADLANPAGAETLPVGQVIQIHSLFCEVKSENVVWLCVTRKTLNKTSNTAIVVGDRIRFRAGNTKDALGRPEAIIEEVLPRETILTRAASFKGLEQHPIVANADQMLIVASILQPEVKWGLVDRMIIAAQSGKLKPIVCLNKIDLLTDRAAGERTSTKGDSEDVENYKQVLEHYESLDVKTLETSVIQSKGLNELREILKNKTTVLAGHSGVGKSTLINAIQPSLDLRVGEISAYTDKGRHTTTSARRYELDHGAGSVIDTPGVKVFGLWSVTRDNLEEFFPDVAAGNAPEWRVESYERILNGMTR